MSTLWDDYLSIIFETKSHFTLFFMLDGLNEAVEELLNVIEEVFDFLNVEKIKFESLKFF